MIIPVNTPLINGNEKKYILKALKSSYISSEGPYVKKFEEKFANFLGRKHAIAVSNGTAAIDISIAALDIGPGDEVIVPSFTIISCIHQILRSGATPVFIDSDPLTWNMNVNQIKEKISLKTKAIMVVHIYGLPVDMNPVFKLAKKYNLKIIEDSAEVIGQCYFGEPCGSLGDLSTFSFYSNKHITTGEGGMIVTNNEKIAERCRELRNLCFNSRRRFLHLNLGWNYRMTNLQAAIGLAQLEKINYFIRRKKEIGKFYNESLKQIPVFQLPLEETSYARNIYWVFGIVLHGARGLKNTCAIKFLESKGIGSRPFFYPLHKQPVLKKFNLWKQSSLPISEKISQYGFYIPSGLALENAQQKYVIRKLKEFSQIIKK